MAFPTIASSTEADAGGNVTTLDVAYPAGVATGDLLLLKIAFDGAGDSASAPGFTELVNARASAAADNGAGYWFGRVADGTESGSVTATITGGVEHMVGAMLRVPASSWFGTLAGGVEAAGFANPSASNANPNPPPITPAWGSADTLWIASAAWDGAPVYSSSPASYAFLLDVSPGTSTGFSLAIASRELAAATEDPGTFTISGSDQWAGFLLAIRPAAAGGEAHNASLPAVTGGGVVALGTSSEGHSSSLPAVTGGGVVALAGHDSTGPALSASLPAVTGGGVVALGTSSEGHSSSLPAVTGGGVVALGSVREGHSSSLPAVTGGGTAAVAGTEGGPAPTGCEVDGVYWDFRGDTLADPFILDVSLLDANPGSELLEGAAVEHSLAAAVLRAQWSWGPTAALGPLTTPTAGRLTVLITDTERRFDPLNTDSPWQYPGRLGSRFALTADGAPAFAGAAVLVGWTHDTALGQSTLTMVGPLGEAAGLPIAPGPQPLEAIYGTPLRVTPRDVALAALALAGWPSSRFVTAGAEPFIAWNHATDTAPSIEAENLLDALQGAALAGLALVGERRDGSIGWVSAMPHDSATPEVRALVNCGGVDLIGLTSGHMLERIRNTVRVTGDPSSNEFDGAATFTAPSSPIVERRSVSTSVGAVGIVNAVRPAGPGSHAGSFDAVYTGLGDFNADRYAIEVWEWPGGSSKGGAEVAIAPTLSPGGDLSIDPATFLTSPLEVGVGYRWRIRFRDTSGAWGDWIGAAFSLGDRTLATPYAYGYWADRVFESLASPTPLIELGTLLPQTPAEVAAIVLTEPGDHWVLDHQHVSPTILIRVRVLGLQATLTRKGVEVDAVVEDVNAEYLP